MPRAPRNASDPAARPSHVWLFGLAVALAAFVAVSCNDDASSRSTSAPAATESPGTPPIIREHFPELGATLEFPGARVAGAAPMPYATGFPLVLGPSHARYPYGIQCGSVEHQLGCELFCYINIRALPQEPTHTIDANGHVAFRQEFERQRPLGLVNEDGDATPYREILTVVALAPMDGLPREAYVPALFIDAFYRFGDAAAEAKTRAALTHLLATLEIDPAN